MSQIAANKLFSALKVGKINLEHRVVMAPLTRLRADWPGAVPNDLMAEYYSQRASKGGLIISEATSVTDTNLGYKGAPGIYSDEQVKGWKKVTSAVHQKGGLIFLQLWHTGRVAHVDLSKGLQPVAPSVVPFNGRAFTDNGWVEASPARPLATEEIPSIIELYVQATKRAMQARFDGVELHSGNGYLLDQFLQDGSNKRTDAYGGSIENRTRLLLEITRAVQLVWEAGRVAVRISPSTEFNEMHDSDPDKLFGYLAGELNKLDIAYLHIIEPRIKGNIEVAEGLEAVASESLRKVFKGTLLSAGGFDPQSAQAFVQSGSADAVVFGRYFISNPDLPERIKNGLPLNDYDRDTFYGGNAHGYTDYPEAVRSAVAAR